MRFLPYLLVASMTVPVLLWVFIGNFVVRGSSTAFTGADYVILGTLGCFVVAAFLLLSTWMHRHMANETP